MSPRALVQFLWHLENIERTQARMDKLFRDEAIRTRDIDAVYEALFLRAVTSFEVFLEELFVAILRGKVSYPKGKVSLRMRATSSEALMDILMQGNRYLSWLPFSATEERAKLYLNGGRPFAELTAGDKLMIKTITTVRHAIAHRSRHAIREFQRTVIASHALLPRERNPAGFLRSQVHNAPVSNRFEVYIGELGRVATTLCGVRR